MNDIFVHNPLDISIFSDLYVPSALSYVEIIPVPKAFAVYDRLSAAGIAEAGLSGPSRWPSGQTPKKVYLSRSDVPRRRLLNEGNVEQIARKCGYDVLLPASLNLSEVIDLYRNVDVICGPSGSSFLNMLYMKPGSRAIMISHPLYSQTAYLCCQFGSLRNVDVSLIFGETVSGEEVVGLQESFVVNEAALAEHMSRF